MDFWASVEHKIRYKKEPEIPDKISTDLIKCANLIEKIDSKMQKLNKKIMRLEEGGTATADAAESYDEEDDIFKGINAERT